MITEKDNSTVKDLAKTAEAAVDLLKKTNKTVACAESCTGGMLAENITSVSGASSVFEMGIVSYSCNIKNRILGVKRETLEKYGAVSRFTAQEMAQCAREKAGSDIGVSVTGVAGPSMSEGKPVGLVFIALSSKDGTAVKQLEIENRGRRYIREYACAEVFKMIEGYLKNGTTEA